LRTRRARCAVLIAALALLAPAMAVQAQERSRRGGPAGPEEADQGAIQRGTLAGEFTAHLQEVRQRLKLQTEQQAAWAAFARRVQALMEDQMRGMPQPDDREDAVHQINRRVDVVRNRLAAMEDIADAAGQLYSALSPDQRKIADELLPTTVPSLYSGLGDFAHGPPAGGRMIRKKGP
jgi:S-adenosylmethionine:diacylglycerol 3-amino-3-carboxypropyl transferase